VAGAKRDAPTHSVRQLIPTLRTSFLTEKAVSCRIGYTKVSTRDSKLKATDEMNPT